MRRPFAAHILAVNDPFGFVFASLAGWVASSWSSWLTTAGSNDFSEGVADMRPGCLRYLPCGDEHGRS